MSTTWVVVAGGDQFTLDAQNAGEMTFTVSNPGPAADTVVFDVLPDAGAQRSWFTIKEPQRMVEPTEAVSFLVKVEVPAGTPARRYAVAGRAYSASAAPEESSRTSSRVNFDVGASVAPKKKPWPILVAAVVLVLIVAGVLVYVLWPSGKQSTQPDAIPNLNGTYHGFIHNEQTDIDDDITLILTQSGSRLTAVLSDSRPTADKFVGSGTVKPDRTITMQFDAEGVMNFDGSEVSPGRLTGKWAYENKSGRGTFDVCTCR